MKYLVFLLFISFATYAQLPQVRFEHLTSKDGLPSNNILNIVQDKAGFVWVGTRKYLTRYDGYRFQNFTQVEGIYNHGVSVDWDNNIWFSSTTIPFGKIDNKTFKINNFSSKLPPLSDGNYGNIFFDYKKQVWISDFHGVYRFDPQTFKFKYFPLPNTTYKDIKGDFIEDKQKNLWIIGLDVGIYKYDPIKERLQCVIGKDIANPAKRFSFDASRSIIDENGIIWIAAYQKGLIRFDPQTEEIKFYDNYILAVCADKDENGKDILWVSNGKTVGIFRPDQEKFYFYEDVYSDDIEVFNICKSPTTGVVWFCTIQEGIFTYNPHNQLIKNVSFAGILPQNNLSINAILKDKTDSIGQTFYLGFSRWGMVKWNKGDNSKQFFKYPHYPDQAETRQLLQDEEGKIWVFTNQWQTWVDGKENPEDNDFEGIFVFDPKKQKFLATPFTTHHGFFTVPFYSLGMEDSKKRLWIINHYLSMHVVDKKTGKELNLWDKEDHKALMNDRWIMDILEDKQGRFWLATTAGIFYFDEKTRKFHQIKFSDDDREISVIKLLLDREGNVWVTGWDILAKISRNYKVKMDLSSKNGIYDVECRQLAEDNHRNIWIGTLGGLQLYIPSQNRFLRFTQNDGLMSDNTTFSFYMNEGKELFIGQKNGLNIVNTEDILQSKAIDNIAVSSVVVNNEQRFYDWTKPFELKRTENAIVFNVSALNFLKTNQNHYSYYLEGLEENWIDARENTTFTYNNLSPGDYTFHVRMLDEKGNKNMKAATVIFSIQPYYYETWWFKTLIVALIIGLSYLFYRFRINQILKLQEVRNRISRDLHDDIGSSLSSISLLSVMASKKIDPQSPSNQLLKQIPEEVSRLSSAIDDMIWNIRPENDDLENFFIRLRDHTVQTLQAQDIEVNIDFSVTHQVGVLSMEVRRNIFLIVKEALHNITKHAHAKHVDMKLNVQKGMLVIEMVDDGKGFDTQKPSTRNGLRNMTSRATEVGGTFEIKSEIGEGSEIVLRVPMLQKKLMRI
jgi:ligand-binding sensor domain-containing protein/two-component sensor histidine kinase